MGIGIYTRNSYDCKNRKTRTVIAMSMSMDIVLLVYLLMLVDGEGLIIDGNLFL